MYQGQLKSVIAEVKRQARDAGSKNLPSSNATNQTQEENDLDSDARQHALRVQKELESAVVTAQSEVSKLANRRGELASTCSQLVNPFDLESATRSDLQQVRPKLVDLKVEELQHLAQVNLFKADNSLTRQAVYPDSLSKHLSFVFFGLAVETVLNAVFFENNLGLIGGAFLAFLVSLVNLTLAAGFGYFFRYHSHVRTTFKAFGWSVLVVALLWSVYFNSAVATYRHQYQLSHVASEAFSIALSEAPRVFVLNWPFEDLESFLLFFVGLGLAAFAFYKGYSADDVYPGYSRVFRPYRDAKEAYQPEIASVNTNLAASGQKHLDAIDRARNELGDNFNRVVNLKAQLKTAKDQCSSQLAQISLDHSLVRDAFRQTNIAIRTTPAPHYFSVADSIIEPSYDGGYSVVIIALDSELALCRDLREQYSQALRNSEVALRSEIARSHNHLFTEFEAQVVRAAEERIASENKTIPPAGRQR